MTNQAQVMSSKLQREVLDEVRRKNLTTNELATRLGLLPVGVEVILARQQWTMETALQVAEAVGLEVELSVRRGT